MGTTTSMPRDRRSVLLLTTHNSYWPIDFDAGADDPQASLRAAVAAAAWPGRSDFQLRELPGRGALHEAYDRWWAAGQPIVTRDAAKALSLSKKSVVMAWTSDQWAGGECHSAMGACASTA